jgi:PIN domain nuclease of toxin-antitoxin system
VIVADTHVIIWAALQPASLSRRAKTALARANDEDGIIFCEISLWEIAMLIQKDRLQVGVDYQDFIRLLAAASKYVFRGISPEIAELSTTLPAIVGSDPADRIIAATALVADVPLVTADQTLRSAINLKTIW